MGRRLPAALLVVATLAMQCSAATAGDAAGTTGRRHFVVRPLLSFDFEYERNFDLDRDEDDDVRELEPMARLNITYAPHERLRAFLEVETPLKIENDQDDGRRREFSINLNQAYVAIEPIAQLGIRVGRQLVRDDREWLFDENLDGVRLLYRLGGLSLDASATRVNIVQRNLRDSTTRGDGTETYALLATYRFGDALRLGAYVIRREGKQGEEGRPALLGLRMRGAPWSGQLEYWLDLAAVRGRDEAGRRLSGHGFDLGATYTLSAPMRPRLTIGHAWGSGNGSAGGNTNRAFRQTGLQSNEATFGGLAKFKYYGEVLDPELSNLHIATLGIGFSPSERVSIDLVYHRYRQDRIADRLRDAAIDLRPNRDRAAQSRDLGQAIDLVVGVALTRAIGVEFAAGYFMPGRALRVRTEDGFRKADGAAFLRLEFEVAF